MVERMQMIKYLVNLQGNLKFAKYGVGHIFSDAATNTVLYDDDMSAGQRDVTEVQCSRTGG